MMGARYGSEPFTRSNRLVCSAPIRVSGIGGSLSTYSTISAFAATENSQAHPQMSVWAPQVEAWANTELGGVHGAEGRLHDNIDL